jgi:hypothetical protein
MTTIKITESDVLALFDSRYEGQREFDKLDASDGTIDGVYYPKKARQRARARVREGGFDELEKIGQELESVELALQKAESKKARSVDKFRAAAEIAAEAVGRAAGGLKFSVPETTREYPERFVAVNMVREDATLPLLEVLREVQAGTVPYRSENPDKEAKYETRYETVDLEVLYHEWIAVRDANAVPLQNRADTFRSTNYDEYMRLNDEAHRIMDDAEARIFGKYGFSLSDYSYNPRYSNKRTVERRVRVEPPKFTYDERVPAAETILRKAEADPAYRRELTAHLADTAKLAVLLSVGSFDAYSLPAAQKELREDLVKLEKAHGFYASPLEVPDAVREITRDAIYNR